MPANYTKQDAANSAVRVLLQELGAKSDKNKMSPDIHSIRKRVEKTIRNKLYNSLTMHVATAVKILAKKIRVQNGSISFQ